eukprot:TRINITY_DN5128_c0_g2_i4.p2 TRINITY_DN5128_c0_g2~~TRINITY_DN5128_c0_g2_i4.p2  ORF type:complete len:210 (+),score=17.22 TRINITY_DN5128_c0_g2_i4:138-767(+)
MDKGVTDQQVEQQQALKQTGNSLGHIHGDLEHLPPYKSQCQQRAGNNDAKSMHTTKENNDDGGVAVPGRHLRNELTNGARDLRSPGQAGGGTTHQESKPGQPSGTKTCESGCPMILPYHIELKTDKTAGKQHPDQDRSQQPERQPQMQACAGNQRWQQGRVSKHHGLGKAKTIRIFERTVHHIQQQIQRDVIEHDGGENLVAMQVRFQS